MDRLPLVIRDLTAKIPVIQGGMGVGISLSNLAGHVALCGGVGVISTAQIGWQEEGFDDHPIETNLKAIEKHIKKAKEIADGSGIIAVNIMVATRKYEEYVKAAVNAGADLIISGAGLPVGLPALVENSRTRIAPVVSSEKSASVILKLWDRKYKCCPDLLVIEGPRAGGHLGFTAEQLAEIETMNFEGEIQKIIAIAKEYSGKYGYKIPVVAAGGIYDRADMDRCMALGVDGVQVSTRFVTTFECDAGLAYKQAYINARKEDIRIVKSPVGMPGRAIYNEFIRKTEAGEKKLGKCHQCIVHCDREKIPYCISDALIHAAEGDLDHALLFCGDNAWRAEKLEHVADIMKEFAGE